MVVRKKAPAETPKQLVFVDRSRRVFVLTGEAERHNEYLTCRDEEIQIVKLDHGNLPKSLTHDQASKINAMPTSFVGELIDYEGPSNAEHAARLWRASGMPKSSAAMVEICRLLGEPVPEVPVAVRERRAAAGKRLHAAREAIGGYTLQQLCVAVKLTPQDARKQLRAKGIEKPSSAGWVWADEAAARATAKTMGWH